MYPPRVSRQQFGKDVPEIKKNIWRRRFLCGPCGVKEKKASSSSQNFLFMGTKLYLSN
jgi:hypothetical protein